MNIYLVGGAVRDKILGQTPTDLDYVVVGATEKEMEREGFKRVGKSFQFFFTPKTKRVCIGKKGSQKRERS